MIRPLITAALEYYLAYLIITRGKYQKKTFFWVLFFLASYQLGEVVIFLTEGGMLGFRIAYIATTMLPPLGVLLIEKMTKKNYGYVFFQVLSLFFISFIMVTPQIALNFELGQFCVRIFEYHPIFANYWLAYYQGTLLFSMMVMVWEIWKNTDKKLVERLKVVLLGYISFDGVALLIGAVVPWFKPSIASLMCALALCASFLFASLALEKKLVKKMPQGKWGIAEY
jgi:hypothetical protein